MDFRSRFVSLRTLHGPARCVGRPARMGRTRRAPSTSRLTPRRPRPRRRGHPDLPVKIDRTGTDNEDIRDLYLDLPPGLIGNTTTVGACTDAQFNSDTCPANSLVGSVSADAVAVGLTLPPTTGTIYNLVPGPTEPGAIGIVLRPRDRPFDLAGVHPGNDRGPAERPQRRQPAERRAEPAAAGIPRCSASIPVDITVNSLTLTLNGAGTLAPSTYFLTNPTSCGEAVFKARAISYLDQEVTKTTSFTPTNCAAVPFDPFFTADFNPPTVSAKTAPITTAGTPAARTRSPSRTSSTRRWFSRTARSRPMRSSRERCPRVTRRTSSPTTVHPGRRSRPSRRPCRWSTRRHSPASSTGRSRRSCR